MFRESHGRRRVVLLAVTLGQFLIQLDLTVVNVALPAIGRDLPASVSGLQWVVDGYNLAVASLLLSSGRFGDRSGHRRVYLVGLAVFGAGSALCAAAPAAGWLVAFRVVQGVGAAIELPATLAILTHTFPDRRERAQAVGIWTGAAGSSLVLGPVLGGQLIAWFGWRSVFLVNLPVVGLIVVLVLRSVRGDGEPDPRSLDVPGQLTGAGALALLAGAAIEAGHLGFTAPLPVGLAGGGLLALVVFLVVETRTADAMLPLTWFGRPSYAAANAGGVVMGFDTIGVLFCYALFFQQVQHDSALGAGLRFVPLTAAFVLTGPLVGRLVHRTGHRLPMSAGAALLAVGAGLMIALDADLVWLPFVVFGVGYGFLSTPMAAAALSSVPADRAGMASATNLTARLVGGVFGVAVLGSFLSATPGTATAGLHRALWVALAVAATSGTLIWGLRERRGEPKCPAPRPRVPLSVRSSSLREGCATIRVRIERRAGVRMSGKLIYEIVPVVVAALGVWSLWLGRSRLKNSLYLPLLTTAAVLLLVKGLVWPDGDTRHPLVDAALMLLGFLLVTRLRLDRLARQAQLRPDAVQDSRRTRLIWLGITAGVVLNAAWLLVDR